jgi:hypothetical protein
MRKLLFFVLTLVTCYGNSQKHYLIKYDRIANDERYYELTYYKGTYQESEISKPNVKKGDVLHFRALNVNPYVFDYDVVQEDAVEQDKTNSAAVLNGFSSIMTEFDGAFEEVGYSLSDLTGWYAPETPSFRGESSVSAERLSSISRLKDFHSSLNSTYAKLMQYQKAINSFYATDLTKEEIVNNLKIATQSFNFEEYNSQLRKLKKDYEFIASDTLIYDEEHDVLDESYLSLIETIETSVASPNKSHELLDMMESADFTSEKVVVVGFENSDWGLGYLNDINDVGFMDYSLHFKKLYADDSEYEYDNLLQNHDVTVSVESPGHFSWATGLIVVQPFGGFKDFALKELSFGDSIAVVQDASKSFRMTLGTSLLYNFSSKGPIVPHALFGASIGFLGTGWDIEKPVNFLLGGGMCFKKFPYLSLSAGISLCQNTELKNGFDLDQSYFYSNSIEDISYFTRKVFTPGYFIGLNVKL